MNKASNSFLVITCTTSAAALACGLLYWYQKTRRQNGQNPPQFVTPDNETLLPFPTKDSWRRGTYILVMHEPPHLFYEPKEWSVTSILLLKTDAGLSLPGGIVRQGESYEQSAVRQLNAIRIDVCQPENCLHHLFTFPYDPQQIWGDCYECVYCGRVEDLQLSNTPVALHTLEEIQDVMFRQTTPGNEDAGTKFEPETDYTLKLYFQRQGDLRARRRLLKAYSSMDLEHYGLRSEKPLVLMDFNDKAHQEAVEFTMQTDDGMRPQLLHRADIIIVGCSRTGKTPLSIFLSQTTGLKVANIPLVFELSPPKELTDDARVDPRRVFCLVREVDEMEKLRKSRLQRELKGHEQYTETSTYANYSYIRKDLAKARNLSVAKGYTEVDVSERALEEVAGIIISKMKERFPDMHISVK